MLLTVIVFAIGNEITNNKRLNRVLKHGWISTWRLIAPVSMPLCAMGMLLITLIYDNKINWMSKIDRLITTRLSVGHESLNNYGVKLFGQRVELVGNGGSVILPTTDKYNFPDCSYIYILITSGMVMLIIFIAIYVYGAFRNIEDIYLLYVIMIIGINCMIAHHLPDLGYNPFTLMVMAQVIPNIKERKEYVNSKVQCYINF